MNTQQPITRALLTAIRHSAQPMVITDPSQPDHPMIAVNQAFERLTGYAAADVVGRNCRFLQGKDTDAEATRRIGRCIAERRGCIEWVLNHRRDGSKFWNLLFISPVFDARGELLHFLGNQRDITQGPPPGLRDYTLGKADMPTPARIEFNNLLVEMPDEGSEPEAHGPARAAVLDRMIEAARRLNDLTTDLAPAPWSPP
jgi:PAS domain S-box-containing protein